MTGFSREVIPIKPNYFFIRLSRDKEKQYTKSV